MGVCRLGLTLMMAIMPRGPVTWPYRWWTPGTREPGGQDILRSPRGCTWPQHSDLLQLNPWLLLEKIWNSDSKNDTSDNDNSVRRSHSPCGRHCAKILRHIIIIIVIIIIIGCACSMWTFLHGIKPVTQQWQWWILNPLSHQGTPEWLLSTSSSKFLDHYLSAYSSYF